MKKLYATLSVFLLVTGLTAQEGGLKYCGADEMRISMLKNDQRTARAVMERDQALERFTEAYTADFYAGLTRSATYTIPVVFHVIHHFGSENISDAQIMSGLDILNKTFRKQLADTGSIVAAFKPIHADCDIEFRLAQIDPGGNCHSGINRIASPLTYIGDHSVKSLIQWPPHMYLNVYIVSDAAGLAGHCVWPSDADTIPQWDGIVIAHNYVGEIGTSNYTRSVAFAHECGHYLNLHHIWGGNNVPGFYYLPCGDTSNCGSTDFVADTPPTIGWQTCNLSAASCGNPVDNVQNAMDYSYCNRMFTQGQKARMHACLNSPIAGRNNLWTPANLAATGVSLTPAPLCAADFTGNKTVICPVAPNNTVTFTNTSYNGPVIGMEWTFSGGSPATSSAVSPTVTYNVPGTYDVKLRVWNGTDTMEVTKPSYVKVLPATGSKVYPYSEGFETVTPLYGPDWFINDFGGANMWNLVSPHAYSGAWSVLLNNASDTGPGGGKDELISPVINLSGAGSMRISFRYAFARKDSVNNDRLQLLVNSNCSPGWVQRLSLTDTTLETAPPDTGSFYPAGPFEWKQASASIPASFLTDDFRFKFVHTSHGGNNLYIDDINIDVNAGIQAMAETISALKLYPNPADAYVNLDFNLSAAGSFHIEITDMLGKTVYSSGKRLFTAGAHTFPVYVGKLEAGIYTVKMGSGREFAVKSLLIGNR